MVQGAELRATLWVLVATVAKRYSIPAASSTCRVTDVEAAPSPIDSTASTPIVSNASPSALVAMPVRSLAVDDGEGSAESWR